MDWRVSVCLVNLNLNVNKESCIYVFLIWAYFVMRTQCCFSSWEGLDDWGLPYSGEA